MSDLPLKKYRSRSPDNPYLEGFGTTTANPPEKSLSNQVWMGNAENVTWRELKEKIKAIRGAKCECCGALGKLDLHHITPRKNKGKPLHLVGGNNDGKPNDEKLSRWVWGEV